MENNIVKVEGLWHKYNAHWAVQDINFEIRKTGILGLLGSNGAGKSTTMNVLCGVLSQTRGKIYIEGIDMRANPVEAKKKIGFLPQQAPLHLDLTVDEYLIYCAQLRLMDSKNIPAALAEAKERCGVSHFGTRLIKNLSGGYRQRVGIAQAIIHKPSLIVLDEPTNGLDPNQIFEVRKLIKEIAEDSAVIFSSHILSEIEATCEEVKMIEHGRMVFSDTMSAFNRYIASDTLLIKLDNPPPLNELLEIDGITGGDFIDPTTARLKFDKPEQITERLIHIANQRNWHLTEIFLEKISLDEIFAQLSNNKKNKSN
ncbi:MAG: transporter ATP-binding protein [Sphingobacterium sp.]|jgi:ABC-2 type transport system ATP-binding protein|nr:transporter ATP-binding protein [Sphingobacterium sp.]